MDEQTQFKPMLGVKFPEITVQTTLGKMKLPKAFSGKWFILFSHPADFTPVCTTEFVSFQKRYDEFKNLNTELIGLSVDQVYSHIKWVKWIKETLGVGIDFPIIADNGSIAELLGLIHAEKGNNTVRAVFVVDPEGTIRVIHYYPHELGRNLDEILRMIKALQVSDAKNVRMPANWPNNELIGNKVIVPPAEDIKAADYKQSKYDNYDWWFCYTDVEKN